MEWTKELPRRDGYYWLWQETDLGTGVELLLVRHGETMMFGDDRFIPLEGWLYYGPIGLPAPPPPPQPPQ